MNIKPYDLIFAEYEDVDSGEIEHEWFYTQLLPASGWWETKFWQDFRVTPPAAYSRMAQARAYYQITV
jgi:hypothetical protein